MNRLMISLLGLLAVMAAFVVDTAAALGGEAKRMHTRTRLFITSKTHRGPQRIGGITYIPYRGGMVPVPAGGAQTVAEELAKNVADIRAFVETKYDPLSGEVAMLGEELIKVQDAVRDVLEAQRKQTHDVILSLRGGTGSGRFHYVSSTGFAEADVVVPNVAKHGMIGAEFHVLVEHQLDDSTHLLVRIQDELPVVVFHEAGGSMH